MPPPPNPPPPPGADARMNSLHLEPDRRDQFRRAREALYGACGELTISGSLPPPASPPTAALAANNPALADARFVLLDRDCVYPLRVGVNTVGRMPDNDVVIEDPYVSRRHCAILVHAGEGCELHDVASRNGTLLNGRRLAGPTRLKSGDTLSLCDHRLLFLSRDDVPSTSKSSDGPVTEFEAGG
jgi:pSer/pThr/pTyr-binding forkhead associated (FHA) protein